MQPTEKGIICVDVDGTVCRGGFYRGNVCEVEGAKQVLWKYKDQGYQIIYYTARSWTNRGETLAWLVEHEFPVDDVICGKVLAVAYIGDEAIGFRGDWGEVEKQLEERLNGA